MLLTGTLYFLIPLVSLFGIKRERETKTSLSVDSTVSIRGIGMILIMMVHATKSYKGNLTFFFMVSGIVGVAACFFVSGYGLYYGYMHKKNYLKHFISKKFSRLLITYIIVYLIFFITECIKSGDIYPVKNILAELFTLRMGNSPLWYFKIQLLVYLIFFFTYKFLPHEKAKMPVMFLLVILYIVLAWIFKLESYWYNTVLFFPLGCLFKKYDEKLLPIIKKWYVIILLFFATGLIFAVIYLFGRFNLDFFVDTAYEATFILFIMGLLTNFKKSKFLNFMGKYSFEIYLVHTFLLNFSVFDATNWYHYIIFFIVTVAVSYLISIISDRIHKSLMKKLN